MYHNSVMVNPDVTIKISINPSIFFFRNKGLGNIRMFTKDKDTLG